MFLSKRKVLQHMQDWLFSYWGYILYWKREYSLPLFRSAILLPDIALLAYLINKEIGAVAYNVTHAKILPSLLSICAIAFSMHCLLALSIIWFMHIGTDHFFGYGLKYSHGFKFTQPGIIGKI